MESLLSSFYTTYFQYEKTCKIKNYTYVVRALTAAWYIQHTGKMPPTSAINLTNDLPHISDNDKNVLLQFYRTKNNTMKKHNGAQTKNWKQLYIGLLLS